MTELNSKDIKYTDKCVPWVVAEILGFRCSIGSLSKDPLYQHEDGRQYGGFIDADFNPHTYQIMGELMVKLDINPKRTTDGWKARGHCQSTRFLKNCETPIEAVIMCAINTKESWNVPNAVS